MSEVIVVTPNRYSSNPSNKTKTYIKLPTPDSFNSLAKKAEESAKLAKEQADKVQGLIEGLKNGVSDVSDVNGELIITQTDGSKRGIKFTKTVNGIIPDNNGNIELPKDFIVKFID